MHEPASSVGFILGTLKRRPLPNVPSPMAWSNGPIPGAGREAGCSPDDALRRYRSFRPGPSCPVRRFPCVHPGSREPVNPNDKEYA